MYHDIGPHSSSRSLSIDLLRHQIQFLIKEGLHPVSLETYVSQLTNQFSKRPSFTVTFDDAYISFFDYAIPILMEFNIPSALFVPVSHVGKQRTWDVAPSMPSRSILGWQQLARLAENPLVTIGSHGMSHCSLGCLSVEQVSYELSESKQILESNLSIPIEYFAFPYGQRKDVNTTAINNLKGYGYRAACSTNWDICNSRSEQFHLNRLEIEPQDDINRFRRKTLHRYNYRFYKQKIKNILSFIK
jgi:peptidoglycan/xylan/chitin deacetylase (PgdA/CDA1 family)